MTVHRADRDGAAARAPGVRPRPLAWLLRLTKIAALSGGLMAASFAAYCGFIIYEGNFNPVQQGVLYRSAQLGQGALEAYAREYDIKSVLNLRGAHPGEAWYDSEMAGVRDLHLVHYDYPISAKRFVANRQAKELLDIVRNAPKPLLIHCKSGADRSGLVAALYEYAIAGETAQQADGQLSLYYGHFPYLTSRSGAMDESFWAFVHQHQPGTAK